MAEKIYYPRRLFDSHDGHDTERNNFYDKLQNIKLKATRTESGWEDSYYITHFMMEDGHVWEYVEDADYGVPYSLEKKEISS